VPIIRQNIRARKFRREVLNSARPAGVPSGLPANAWPRRARPPFVLGQGRQLAPRHHDEREIGPLGSQGADAVLQRAALARQRRRRVAQALGVVAGALAEVRAHLLLGG